MLYQRGSSGALVIISATDRHILAVVVIVLPVTITHQSLITVTETDATLQSHQVHPLNDSAVEVGQSLV